MTIAQSRTPHQALKTILEHDDPKGAELATLVAEALPASNLSRVVSPRVFFRETYVLEGAFAPLNFGPDTTYEIIPRKLVTPGRGYLFLCAYQIGRQRYFGLLWDDPKETSRRRFIDGERRVIADSSKPLVDWEFVGTVLAVTTDDGESVVVMSKGVRFDSDGCAMRRERVEAGFAGAGNG